MRKFLPVVIGLTALGVTSSADAADVGAHLYTKAPAAPAVYDWSGLYLGLNGGGGVARTCWNVNNFSGNPIAPPAAEGCHNAAGGVLGEQVGYRWQAANWVFGVEAEGDWASLTGSNVSSAFIPAGSLANRTTVDAIGLLTGQVGYAWSSLLWYAKGGAAVADQRHSSAATGVGVPIAAGTVVDSASETRWGGAVGTGLEFGLAPNWTVGVEYDHLFMGSRDVGFPVALFINSRVDNIKQNVDIGTLRVNYRFGGPPVGNF